MTVVLAAEGYPAAPRTGDVIDGLEKADATDDVLVFRAGVGRDADGRWLTAGGRVLNVTGLGDDVAAARAAAYGAVSAHLVARHAVPHRHRAHIVHSAVVISTISAPNHDAAMHPTGGRP